MAHAKEYGTEQIRNVAVLGHGGSGKSSLIDALAFVSGSSKRHGKVSEGAALTFYRPEEKAHAFSMYCTPAYAEWKDTKLNLLDTPGYLDFRGEQIAAVRAADAALIAVGAGTGVEVGTEKVWGDCEQRGLPRMIFVSMMDKDNADFDAVYQGIKSRLTDKVVPVEIPIGAGEEFRGIINLFSGKAHVFKHGTVNGEFDETDVPAELADQFETWRTELMETIATLDESLLETYLETGELPKEKVLGALKDGMQRGEIFPLFCGAAEKTYGMRALLDKMVELFPSPADRPPETAKVPKKDETVELKTDSSAPFAAVVFKVASESHVGEMAFFKILSGTVENGEEVLNANRDGYEKLAHLSINQGKDRNEVEKLHAGDIGVVARLKDTHVGETLTDKSRPVIAEPPPFPAPDSVMAVHAANRNDEDKLGPALVRLHEEDPTFKSEYDAEAGETLIRGLGEMHLEVMMEKLKERYGVEVTTKAPSIHYRETIKGSAEVQGRYKKQTGGKGQFGDCHIRIRPLPRGGGYEFHDKIVGGAIPGKFIPAVDKGIQEASQRGVLAGYPLVDFEVDLFYGSYHAVDSSEMAFKIAGSLAFQKAAAEAKPILLEPVMKLEVEVPNDYTGDVMGDVSSRRGKVLGMDTQGDRTVISALIPQAELFRYASNLRAMTQGRGHHTRSFYGYEEVPAMFAEKIIAEHKEREGKE